MSFAKAAERPEGNMACVDPARLEKLEEAVLRMGAMRHEMQSLRERVACLEAQLQAEQAESEESSVAAAAGCCEAGLAKQPTDGQTFKKMPTLTTTQTTHSLVESFWDATIFAGLDEVGYAGSLMIFFGVTASFLLQLLFCWIVVSCFLVSDVKYDLDYLRYWRVLYGHSFDFLDHTSGTSLVSKVCQGRQFDREYWNDALLNEINSYLRPVFPGAPGFSIGVVLCTMAVMIWACHISTELQQVGSFASAIYRLPRGETRVSVHKGTRCIESISCRRLILLGCVILARSSIALMLGISGGMWLSQTRDVTNIMLNAVALLFILDIDDLLYKVLAPKHSMQYLHSIREFQVGSRKTWAGMDLSSIMKLLVLVVTVALFCRYVIYECALQAKHARELLCGGNLNFVYGSHPSLGPIFMTETGDYNLTREEGMLPGMRPLVTDVVFHFSETTSQNAEVEDWMWRAHLPARGDLAVKHLPDIGELKAWLAMSDQQAPEETDFGSRSYGTFCEDMPWNKSYWEADWVWSTVKALTGATNCQEARPFCDRKDLPLVRMVCPQTCGCTRPDSGLFVDNGCRQLCQEEEEFGRSLNTTKCVESPNIHKSKVWQRWWKGFYETNAGTWAEDNVLMKFAKSGAHGNCSFLSSEDWIAGVFCSHKGGKRPGTVLCPITCGCADGEGDWCPSGKASCK